MKEIKLICPFCDSHYIGVAHKPKQKTVKRTSSVAGKMVKSIKYSAEKYTVQEDCLNCGASKKKIEKALNSGEDYKKPSKEDIIRRLKESGLPTRI